MAKDHTVVECYSGLYEEGEVEYMASFHNSTANLKLANKIVLRIK